MTCKHYRAKCIESRIVLGGMQSGLRRRRYLCCGCGLRFTTYNGGKPIVSPRSQAHVAAQLRNEHDDT